MTFEEYLISKKIDRHAFEMAEPKVFQHWKLEFEQMHENSFTIQKLNLINPLRRKYTLKIEPVVVQVEKPIEEVKPTEPNTTPEQTESNEKPLEVKPQAVKPARPVFKPKMK